MSRIFEKHCLGALNLLSNKFRLEKVNSSDLRKAEKLVLEKATFCD